MQVLHWIGKHWELIVVIVTAGAAAISAAASRTSARTAKDALAEAFRQHLISITPHVTAHAEQMKQVEHGVRQDSVLKVLVTNAGPGMARNVRGTLIVERGPSRERRKEELPVSVPSLPPGGSQTIDAPASSSRPQVLHGFLTYVDAEDGKHWSLLLCPSGDWEFGKGDPPERSKE